MMSLEGRAYTCSARCSPNCTRFPSSKSAKGCRGNVTGEILLQQASWGGEKLLAKVIVQQDINTWVDSAVAMG